VKRKRAAIFSVGGVGSGDFAQGLPQMTRIVGELATRFEVTYYALLPVAPQFRPGTYVVRSPPAWLARIPIKGLVWLFLLARFLIDHARGRHRVLLSFWGYPMGTFVVALSRLVRRSFVVLLLGAELADLPSIGYGQLRRPLSRRLVLATCRGATTLVAASGYQVAGLKRVGVTRTDVQTIPWGSRRELFPFRRTAAGHPLKILQVAHQSEVKDQATLVRAFARLRRQRDARLRIVGGDFMNGKLRRLVDELGLAADVELVGVVPFHEIPAHYAWADMFALTSLSEGQNSAATDAAMCGVLIAGTPVGVIHDLGDEGAVIVRAGDPDDVAQKIEAIAADPAAWEQKVAAAARWAEAHDFSWTVDRLAAALDDAAVASA